MRFYLILYDILNICNIIYNIIFEKTMINKLQELLNEKKSLVHITESNHYKYELKLDCTGELSVLIERLDKTKPAFLSQKDNEILSSKRWTELNDNLIMEIFNGQR